MKNSIKNIGVVALLIVMVTGCANTTLKAPCDYRATFCGTKTKINHW